MGLDDIVKVTITRQTTIPAVASFSDILIAAEFLAADITPAFSATERVRFYSSLEEIATAGYSQTGPVYLGAAAIFAQNPKVSQIAVGRKLTGGDGSETWTEALTNINADNSAWYGLVAGTRTLADQQLVAAWVESNEKLCGLATSDSNAISGTGDIIEDLQTNNYARTFGIYHPDADLTANDPYSDAAWLGKLFPYDPGTSTWKFKTLAGVPSYTLSTSERNTVLGKNGNIYTVVSGVAITEEGWVGEGEFIDIIRGTDWLKARIQERIYTLLINQQKVPYTDGGIRAIEGELKAQLQDAVGINFLSEFTTSAPNAADISIINKGNRLLPDITFTAKYAGAIHSVEIDGTISL